MRPFDRPITYIDKPPIYYQLEARTLLRQVVELHLYQFDNDPDLHYQALKELRDLDTTSDDYIEELIGTIESTVQSRMLQTINNLPPSHTRAALIYELDRRGIWRDVMVMYAN